jgi:15-cis-phytoene desaturase
MTKDFDVIIVGAGLAGLSAGFELSEKGKQVLILESRNVIGGRTSSWTEDGMKVESGLHRFLGFYSALPNLLNRAGVDLNEMLYWEDEIEIRMPDGGPQGVFGASMIHKPIKTVTGFIGNNDLVTIQDKASLSKFFAAGLKDYAANPTDLDQQTVLEYAQKHDVTDNAIKHVLIPLTAGIFFIPPEKYSMYALMGLVGPYLPTMIKARIGAFQGGMTEVMCEPIAQKIKASGGIFITGEGAEELILERDAVTGVKTKKNTYTAADTIVATSLVPAQKLIGKSIPNHAGFQDMLKLPSMPAVTIQFELTERSMEVDRTTFGPLTSWASFAEQNFSTFKHVPGRLSVILTPADEIIKMTDKEIYALAIKDGKRLGIDIEDKIKQFRITRIPHDFYALTPGNEALRPTQATPVAGLKLAGDFTKQPNLATMEGAVVSGKIASEIILQ